MMKLLSCLSLLLVPCTMLCAENWPQWRGPHFNGSSTETDLPSSWSRTDNIRWIVDLPGASAATPVVWEDHLFVSSTGAESKTLNALCYATDGKLLWQHVVSKGRLRQDSRSSFAAPSPATNGKQVAFFYGNGALAVFDLEGNELWSRNIQEDFGQFAFNWTFSSTPLFFDGKLFLQVLQRDVPARNRGFKDRMNESYILAMEPTTGDVLWKHIRPSEAVAETREAFSTPIPFEHNGRSELLVVGGDDLTGHDPQTGKELWRWGTWNPTRIGHWRHVTSPVASQGIILVCAPKGDPIYAIKAGGRNQLGNDAIAWISRNERSVSSDVSTPAYYDNDFFVLNSDQRKLSRLDPNTGRVKWTVRLPGLKKYEASPLAADGKIYMINFAGEVAVVAAKDGKVLNVIPMEDGAPEFPVRSSIVVSDGRLYIRTDRKLFCVGA